MFTVHKYHVTERGVAGAYGYGREAKFSVRLYRLFGLPVWWTRRPVADNA